jgi:hypothetical protein
VNVLAPADTEAQEALPRSRLPHAARAPEESTWSTRSETSMNDVDTDKRRRTLAAEEEPRTSHHNPLPLRHDKIELTRITRIMPLCGWMVRP